MNMEKNFFFLLSQKNLVEGEIFLKVKLNSSKLTNSAFFDTVFYLFSIRENVLESVHYNLVRKIM